MAHDLLSEEQARALLNEACGRFGSACRVALKAGTSPGFISQIRHGRRRMPDYVAQAIGLRVVRGFERTKS